MPGPMRVGGLLSEAAKLGKQTVAGAIELFGAGSKDPGDTRNATQIPIVEPALTGLYQLGQIATDIAPTPYRLYIPAAEESIKKQQLNSQSINRKLGISEPSNAAEVVARIAPAFIGPGEAKGAATVATRAAEGFLPKAAKAVGKTAIEVAVPLRQGGPKTAAAAAGLVVGLHEGADALADDPEYTSVADMIKPERARLQPHLAEKTIVDYLSPEVLQHYNEAVDNKDTETQQQILGLVYQLQQKDKLEALTPPKPDWEGPALGAALITASIVGAYTGSKVLSNVKDRLLSTSVLGGQKAENVATGIATKTFQSTVQNDQAVRDATQTALDGKRLFGKSDQLKLWNAKFDAVSAPSLNSKFNHFLSTGEIKDATTVTQPLGPQLRAIATDLTPDERNLLSDGLRAGSALDDYYATGVQPSFNDKSIEELEQLRDAVNASPKLAPYAQAMKDQYRSMLDLLKEKGRISQDQYNEWITKRPNYVHFSKNIANDPFEALFTRGDPTHIPSDARKGTMWQRSTEEAGGIQVGEAADPVAELPNQWAKTIKQVAIDDVKKPWLEMAASHPVLGKTVKALPPMTRPNDESLAHYVWNNGQWQAYVVNDRTLSEALDFTPFINQSAASVLLSMPKRMFEFGTTGPGNPMFAPTSAVYDTIAGVVNRPKDYELGVLNEFMRKVSNGKVGLGGFDPTAWVTAPIGAVRLAWDSLVQGVADDLAKSLVREDGLVYKYAGPQATQALQTRLASAYSKSVKGMMDEYGASNSGMFTTGSVAKLAPGLAHAAPEFATEAAILAARDALTGNHTTAQKLLAVSHVPFEAARANSLSRIYTTLLKSIHEGFRYQAFATNLPRVFGDEDAMKLMASQTRRLAGDIGQTGAGQAAAFVKQNGAYVNVGVQSLVQFGRMFKENPVTFMSNLSTSMLTLGAMFLGYAAIDPENRAKIRAMSDDELARIVPTFGGLPVPIPPEMRPLVGPYIAVLKDITGMNAVNEDGTDNFDPNIAQAIDRMLTNGLSEEGSFTAQNAFSEGMQGVSPVNSASFPVANAFMAGAFNLDSSFTRYAMKSNDDPQGVRTQEINPLGGDGRLIGDAISARWGKVLESLVGSMTFGYVRAAMDAQRATDGGATDEKAFDVAMSRIEDNWAKQSGPSSMLFQNYEKAKSPNVTEFKLFYAKKEGFDEAIKIMNELILSPAANGKDPAVSMLSQLDPSDIANNFDLRGTALLSIGGVAASVQSIIRRTDLDNRINQLKKQIDDVQNQRATTIEERNKQINELNEERLYYIGKYNDVLRISEDQIRDMIGDPSFTWQDFAKDPKKYQRPLAPVAEPSAPVGDP